MKKDLPKVYANKIERKLCNNSKSFCLSKDHVEIEETKKEKINITKKIKDIFNSHNYIYKIEVEIETINGKYIKKVIGKNKDNLITIENELIPIKEIIDIKKI